MYQENRNHLISFASFVETLMLLECLPRAKIDKSLMFIQRETMLCRCIALERIRSRQHLWKRHSMLFVSDLDMRICNRYNVISSYFWILRYFIKLEGKNNWFSTFIKRVVQANKIWRNYFELEQHAGNVFVY